MNDKDDEIVHFDALLIEFITRRKRYINYKNFRTQTSIGENEELNLSTGNIKDGNNFPFHSFMRLLPTNQEIYRVSRSLIIEHFIPNVILQDLLETKL